MMNATIWYADRTDNTVHRDVRLCAAGVIVQVLIQNIATETLIPWHRVHQVTSTTPGEIALELGQ
jgi:uncharacterized protein (UPF0248 family)